MQCFDEAALEFQERIIARSGLGDQTYLPPCAPPSPHRARCTYALAESLALTQGVCSVRPPVRKAGMRCVPRR